MCRILYKLDELVRPYVHKILVVIEPLLIDEDYYARVEGREIIANLSKAAGTYVGTAALLLCSVCVCGCMGGRGCNVWGGLSLACQSPPAPPV